MNRKELIKAVTDLLHDNDVEKSIRLPKQVFHISDNEGNSKDFYVSKTNKTVPFSQKDVEEVLNAYFSVVVDALKRGEMVTVINFGSFGLHYRKPRMAKNVLDGEEIFLPGRHIPRFWPGNEMKRACKVFDMLLSEKGLDPSLAEPVLENDDEGDDEDEDWGDF